MMRQQIIMYKVLMQRCNKIFIIAILQSYSIIYACIVHQSVDAAIFCNYSVYGLLAHSEDSDNSATTWEALPPAASTSLTVNNIIGFVPADDHRYGSFCRQYFYNTFPNTFGAATYNDHFVF